MGNLGIKKPRKRGFLGTAESFGWGQAVWLEIIAGGRVRSTTQP